MKKSAFVLLVLLAALPPAALVAQEFSPRFLQSGLTASIGLTRIDESVVSPDFWIGGLVHIRPWLAVKPGLMLLSLNRKYDNSLSGLGDYTRESTGFGGSLAADYTRSIDGGLQLFAGPVVRFTSYSRNTDYTDGSRSEERDTAFELGAHAGGQVMLAPRFGFFGDLEVGLRKLTETEKRWNNVGTVTEDGEYRNTQWGTHGARLGAVIYLN